MMIGLAVGAFVLFVLALGLGLGLKASTDDTGTGTGAVGTSSNSTNSSTNNGTLGAMNNDQQRATFSISGDLSLMTADDKAKTSANAKTAYLKASDGAIVADDIERVELSTTTAARRERRGVSYIFVIVIFKANVPIDKIKVRLRRSILPQCTVNVDVDGVGVGAVGMCG